MTMLDKCARAIGGAPFPSKAAYRKARAVLEALRDPPPEIIAAIWAKIDDAKKAAGIARLGPGPGVRDVINAYIDEAMKERT